MVLRWVCMQPLASPVVPEVYGMTHRSSGPAVNGPGDRPCPNASRQSVTPRRTISGTRLGNEIGHGQLRGAHRDNPNTRSTITSLRSPASISGSRRGYSSCDTMAVVAPASLAQRREFTGEVHGIEGYHDGIGAQNSVVGDHELRAVLHEQQHAVALSDSAPMLQVAGDQLRLSQNLGKADRGVVKHQTRACPDSGAPTPRGCKTHSWRVHRDDASHGPARN